MSELKYLIIPVISVVLAQIVKFLIETIMTRKFDWPRLFNGNGGMPSSHTAFTFSLAMAVGLGEGFNSAIFAVALILACIVAYDSMGLRMESGKQAVAINLLMEKTLKKEEKKGYKKLQERLGHKPLEVVAGAIFGAFVAYLLMMVL